MLAVELIRWWYSKGWGIFIRNLFEKLASIADFFSFGTIFRTLFAPFRQIDSEKTINRSLSERLSSLFGHLISRLIGAITRLFIAIAGLVILVVGFIIGATMIVAWPFVPLLPFAGIVLSFSGVSL